jgi:alpha-tubulin suppressor-like RCC1 family protein
VPAVCQPRRLNKVAACSGGELYIWGFGEHLYSTIKENFAYVPEKIQLPKKVLDVACGRCATFFILFCVCVRQPRWTPPVALPRAVCSGPAKEALSRCCVHGARAGRGHILARTEEQDVYSWGACDFGQLGHGRKVPTSTPRLILQGKKVRQRSAQRSSATVGR